MTPTHRPKLAIVEDETDFRVNAMAYLQASGYQVWGAEDATSLYPQLAKQPVDILILDVGLPGESGFEIAQHIRQQANTGIIILSAHNTVQDRLAGLGYGADCYLTKPIEFKELIANIEAIWRRMNAVRADTSAAQGIKTTETNAWLLNTENWTLTSPSGICIPLTSREFAFLEALFKANGQAVSRANLAKLLASAGSEYDYHSMDVLISRLRKKGQAATGCSLPIKTVQSIGFAFTAQFTTGLSNIENSLKHR